MEFIPLQYDQTIMYQWNLYRCHMNEQCCSNEFIPLQKKDVIVTKEF